MPPTITLLTDFGLTDTYVGQMRGVIGRIAPGAAMVDLTHAVRPQDVVEAGVRLDDAVDAFGPGTIHVAVVDPGVGTDRAAIAVGLRLRPIAGGEGGEPTVCTVVTPDNGLVTPLLDRATEVQAVRLTEPGYWRAVVSATFHGRDVFAPAGAYLAAGVALEALGEPTESLHRLALPAPRERGGALEAAVLYADHFGNLVTNLRRGELERWAGDAAGSDAGGAVEVWAGQRRIGPVRRTYGEVGPGEAVAYLGNSDRLELAVREGSAAARLGGPPWPGVVIRRRP